MKQTNKKPFPTMKATKNLTGLKNPLGKNLGKTGILIRYIRRPHMDFVNP